MGQCANQSWWRASLSCDSLGARADQVTDTIMAIDVVLNQLMLTNGEVYVFPKSFPVSKLAIGSKVKVTYTSSNGVNSVSAVARVK